MNLERSLTVSPTLLTAIQCEAARQNRSMSACVQHAWSLARSQLAGIAAPIPLEQGFDELPMIPVLPYEHKRAEAIYAAWFHDDDEPRVVRLVFSGDILDEMTFEADRLARPLSWIVQRAWSLASADDAGDTIPIPRFDG